MPRRVEKSPSVGSKVYFFLSGDFVKIGHAQNPSKRLKNLQIGNPLPIGLVMTEDGGIDRERELHRRFHKSRYYGEWFRISQEIVDYVLEATRSVIPDLASEIAQDPERLEALAREVGLTSDEAIDELEAITLEAAR